MLLILMIFLGRPIKDELSQSQKHKTRDLKAPCDHLFIVKYKLLAFMLSSFRTFVYNEQIYENSALWVHRILHPLAVYISTPNLAS